MSMQSSVVSKWASKHHSFGSIIYFAVDGTYQISITQKTLKCTDSTTDSTESTDTSKTSKCVSNYICTIIINKDEHESYQMSNYYFI